eukprot:COSAG01_NODE_2851_length_6937_cov_13.682228_16_plen_104_part_00
MAEALGSLAECAAGLQAMSEGVPSKAAPAGGVAPRAGHDALHHGGGAGDGGEALIHARAVSGAVVPCACGGAPASRLQPSRRGGCCSNCVHGGGSRGGGWWPN